MIVLGIIIASIIGLIIIRNRYFFRTVKINIIAIDIILIVVMLISNFAIGFNVINEYELNEYTDYPYSTSYTIKREQFTIIKLQEYNRLFFIGDFIPDDIDKIVFE